MTRDVAAPRSLGAITFSLVGFLFLVELTSGLLQGWYVPLISDLTIHLGIPDGDFNYFEAAQLLFSSICVPVLAKLGDMFGHKRILLVATVGTAAASWWLVVAGDFWSFLIAWALQGFYVVWLPLEVALIFDRGRRSGTASSQTRRAAGLLVVGLEAGAIVGALLGGRMLGWTGGDLAATLAVPAIAVSAVFFVILFGVPESEPLPGRKLDVLGFTMLTISLLLVTGGLVTLRQDGASIAWAVGQILVGLALLVPFGIWELRHPDPAIDLRVIRKPTLWPVFATAALFGISVLGAQAPLSTFAGTDPEVVGYGLGLDSSDRSTVIGVYLIAMIIGAVLFAVLSKRVAPRVALIGAALLVAAGYLLLIPLHDSLTLVLANLVIAGLGSGALVAALPAAAAAAAPRGQTGIASALTNTTKTIGGSFASTVFGIALAASALSLTGEVVAQYAPLAGYLTVWAICGGGALLAAVLLLFVPKLAFADPEPLGDGPLEAAEDVAGVLPGDEIDDPAPRG